MEEKYLYQLAELVLPSEVLRYFSIVRIEKDSTLFRIYLDEKMETELLDDLHFESKGFMAVVDITDFPIRDHKVIIFSFAFFPRNQTEQQSNQKKVDSHNFS